MNRSACLRNLRLNFTLWLLTGIALVVSSCEQSSRASSVSPPSMQGGISVGNGINGGISVGNGVEGGLPIDARLAHYISPHGFEFSYDARLSLVTHSDRLITVNNETLTKESVSEISFQVLQSGADKNKPIAKVSDLRDWLERRNPSDLFEPAQLGEAEGFVFEKTMANQKNETRKEYYMLAPNYTLLKIALLTFDIGVGHSEVKDITQSIHYDIEAPKIQSIKLVSHTKRKSGNLEDELDSPEWLPGQEIEMHIRGSDESGISSRLWLHLEHQSKEARHALHLEMRMKRSEKDFFVFSTKLSDFAISGVYTVSGVLLQDRLGNRLRLVDSSLAKMGIQPERIYIRPHAKEDLEFPKVESIEESVTTEEGITHYRVMALLSDDIAGIDSEFLSLTIRHTKEHPYKYEDWTHRPTKIDLIDNGADKPQKLKAEFEILLPRSFPSGLYVFDSLALNDRSGKRVKYVASRYPQTNDESTIPMPPAPIDYSLGLSVPVQQEFGFAIWSESNSHFDDLPPYTAPTTLGVRPFLHISTGVEDREGPQIDGLVLKGSESVKPGDSVTLQFLVDDAGSGLDVERVFVALDRPDAFFVLTDDNSRPLKLSNLQQIGFNRYEGRFRIPQDALEGVYLMSMVEAVDHAGNSSVLMAPENYFFRSYGADGSKEEKLNKEQLEKTNFWSEEIENATGKAITYLLERHEENSLGEETLENEISTQLPVIRLQIKR